MTLSHLRPVPVFDGASASCLSIDAFGSRGESTEPEVARGRPEYRVRIGDHVIIGPHAHVNGAQIEDCCFIATGAGVFPGAYVGKGG